MRRMSSVLCGAALVLSCSAMLCLGGGASTSLHAAETAAQTADLTLRYVNDSVISLGDVMRRNFMRMNDYKSRGRPLPTTRDEVLNFAEESLNELTEEELLIQYGRDLSEQGGFRLVDHERISQMVMERSKASGHGSSLREQAEKRKFIERKQIIDLVMGYFESRVPHIAPEVMQANYQERQADFRRPARAKVYHIILRPSSQAERKEINEARLTIFRRAQDMNDAVIRNASESRIEAFTVATAGEQEKIIAAAIREIAQQSVRTDLDAVAADLTQQAIAVEKKAVALRDPTMTEKALADIHEQIAAKGLPAFIEAAKKISQGPNAIEGGDMGWIESGTYQAAFDRVAFETAIVGEVSPVFVIDNNAYLIYLEERLAAHSRPFAEVVGEIERTLRNDQVTAIRYVAVAMLRDKASIRDISTISEVFR